MSFSCRLGVALTGIARTLLLIPLLTASVVGQSTEQSHPLESEKQIYHYRMAGGVRLLLFFWVSRQDVGGGNISVTKGPASTDGQWREEIEVIFGSKPERVPGGVNRWGYGRESADWVKDASGGAPILKRTVFEGFIRHSSEESIEEVVSNDRSDQGGQSFWFDATRSTVLRTEAQSEVSLFSTSENFDYRRPEMIFESHRSRLREGPPDRMKQITRDLAGDPLGFLTAVKGLIGEISADLQIRNGGSHQSKPARTYFHNARPYRLTAEKVRFYEKYSTPTYEESSDEKTGSVDISDVVRASFRVVNLEEKKKQDFELWFAVDGNLKGVPLRIEHKPRWWLRVTLNLDLDDAGQLNPRGEKDGTMELSE